MRFGLGIVAATATVAWLTLFTLSANAIRQMGYDAAGAVFLGDFVHPWRAQFNADFSIHLLLMAAWMVWRSRSWAVGLVWGLLTICMGALFLLPYLALAWWRSGSFAGALIGQRSYQPGNLVSKTE
ncbi:DUF1475 domain-containing protein [Novosphingobium sp. KCTC 2891]|uniref:DUF1475 domain-containing protein n=1 Tax=Novosphingobium sp. KCTC 2891 TaxID=2989730 RepID=UPI0022222C7F|nr:DUF1475 domain-containing protein [Novosphingobium sp. KCTC 2891]